VATELRATRRSWTLAFEGSAQFAHREPHRAGTRGLRPLDHHACTSLERPAIFLAPRLVDAMGTHQDLPRFAAMPRGSQTQSLAHSATVILLLWSA
jgi:hypothetical protein